jgi:hypothetical protein
MGKKKADTKPQRVAAHIPSDVYTALLGVALAFILTGLLYVAYRSKDLFGTILPQLGF